MILPERLDDWKGREIAPNVVLLEAPVFNKTLQKWTALANVEGILCIIELSVTLNAEME
jgi:hypothetical protein